mgnify:CR=1 FL=1
MSRGLGDVYKIQVDADMLREKMEMIQNKDTDDKKKKKITWKGRGKREES